MWFNSQKKHVEDLWSDGTTDLGKHITDTYITDTDTTELENLSHNIIDIFIFEA